MVFTEDIVFIHIPKTGGMSCANYLLRTLAAPVYNCHAGSRGDTSRIKRTGIVAITDVNRHCTLEKAEQHIHRLTGTSIADRKVLLAIIRHPFTLEYSFFMHLREPKVIRLRQANSPELLQLAQGDFKTFVANAGYHRGGLRQEDYFLIGGEIPRNMTLLRFEDMATSFPALVQPYVKVNRQLKFPHRNSSAADPARLSELLDEETRSLIYRKHEYLFDRGYYSLDDFR